jgi:hypothetical protein
MTRNRETQTTGELLDWIEAQCRHMATTIDGLDDPMDLHDDYAWDNDPDRPGAAVVEEFLRTIA